MKKVNRKIMKTIETETWNLVLGDGEDAKIGKKFRELADFFDPEGKLVVMMTSHTDHGPLHLPKGHTISADVITLDFWGPGANYTFEVVRSDRRDV